jgi:hypothetical protein
LLEISSILLLARKRESMLAITGCQAGVVKLSGKLGNG